MEADLTETVIAKASDENGVVRIGVLALCVLAKAELARRMRLTRPTRLEPDRQVREERPQWADEEAATHCSQPQSHDASACGEADKATSRPTASNNHHGVPAPRLLSRNAGKAV